MKVPIRSKSTAPSARDNSWPPALLARVQHVAERLPMTTLFLFWLEVQAAESDRAFMAWLRDLASWSKRDLINIVHEMGPAAGERFLDRFDKADRTS